MTSDGISFQDWKIVEDYAAQISHAACANDDAASELATAQMLQFLECLEMKYGRLPSILATRADYLDDLNARVSLFQEAYQRAGRSGDHKNQTLIASSLARLFAEEAEDIGASEKWLALLADSLGHHWDDAEHQEFQELTLCVEELERRSTNSAPT